MKYYIEAFRKYAVFSGRSTRSEFWFFELFSLLVVMVLGFIGGIYTGITGRNDGEGMLLGNLYIVAALLPLVALGVRRLHEIGLSGLWSLICLVPILGHLTLLGMFCIDSQPGPNKYGPNPKGIDPAAVPLQ